LKSFATSSQAFRYATTVSGLFAMKSGVAAMNTGILSTS
jgi:hypothetical protein